ncbi:MAG: hypothetical protein PHW82_05305 [Bacteroidales bacterium]|nr:hypothetical protein [Bacteroidales bacterium]
MEKNLPFIEIPIIEKFYNKFVLDFLKKLDEGNVFKNIIFTLLNILAFAILIGGVLMSFIFIFGENGYVMSTIGNGSLDTWPRIAAVVGLIVGLVLSIILSWVLYSVLRKRAKELNEETYEGLLDFVFIKTGTKLIIVIGELLFCILLVAGILQLVATLIGGPVYFALGSILGIVTGMLPIDMSMETISLLGSYEMFDTLMITSVVLIVSSFVILVISYIYKEVYLYLIKLVKIFINFLPKFAIPLAIRRKEEK